MVHRVGKAARATAARAKLSSQHDQVGIDRYQARMARIAAVRHRNQSGGVGWCILRTNGRRTLSLAESLLDAGVEAWTPSETRRRRIPRSKAFREEEAAIVPSFVFVRSLHLQDLLRIVSDPMSPHPRFTVFQHAGRVPVVADREVERLQAAEDRARGLTQKVRRPSVAIGAKVRVDGAFEGLEGIVAEVSRDMATVLFNGTWPVQISTWLIADNAVERLAA